MRLLFLLLLLLNAAAFGYARFAESRAGADGQLALLQIAPERMKLLKPAASAADRKMPGRVLACLEWGSFAGDEGARAAAALEKFALGDKVTRRIAGESYWVYMPPMKTNAEAEKKAAELKARGISNFFVVQDNDQWQFAISLGTFKTDEGANGYLAQLKQKGVRTAVVGPRGAQSSTFVIRDPGDAIALKIAELKADFPGAQLKAATCADAPSDKS